jgi:hypothetical protein
VTWKLLHLGAEGEAVSVGGINVWSAPWKSQGEEPVAAKHPACPGQEHLLKRYFIDAGGKAHEFAAGEVSPGVWLFLIPARDAELFVLVRVAAYILATVGCFILVRGFEHSPTYVALGCALLAIAMGAAWYTKSRRSAGEA